MKKYLIAIIVLLTSTICFADVTMEKVSDTEVKRTTTIQDVVKFDTLLGQEKQIKDMKSELDNQYNQRKTQLDNALVEVQSQIKKAKEAGVK